ncbi:hypothetical protein [Bradyrhizobium sp. SK17]|uniref:hypothetical protein n=1 Tax=Bradyrhizobium sp. SK17 TaxID=2057741 RepID=UPI0012FE7995|nr:hypothetical protein [Bradyrhizobium sp. SK17]
MGVLARRDVASLIFQAMRSTHDIYFAASVDRQRDARPTDQVRRSSPDVPRNPLSLRCVDGEQTKLCCAGRTTEHVFDLASPNRK